MKAMSCSDYQDIIKMPHSRDILKEFCPLACHSYGVNISGFVGFVSKKLRINHNYISNFLNEIETVGYSERNSNGRLVLTERGKKELKF